MHKTPVEIQNEIKGFTRWMLRLGYAETTIKTYTRLLQNFFMYLKGEAPTQQQIQAFNTHLHTTKISSTYISGHINVIRRYSTYLEQLKGTKLMVGQIHIDKRIPKERIIFSLTEIKQLFDATEDTIQGLFDRALLSLYYGCGLRSKEGILLTPKDLDYSKELVYVKPSKNYQSRYVPMSEQVIRNLQEYQVYAREKINANSPYLLVGIRAEKTNGQYLNRRLKFLMEQVPLLGEKKGASLHSLRHSIATHLLQQGMEIEYIARFLGHKSLLATQHYVRMNHELFTLDQDGKL